MRHSKNEWYKINNKQAVLESENNQHVNTSTNPDTQLPMIFLFKDIKSSIDMISQSLYTCVGKEKNKISTKTKNQC